MARRYKYLKMAILRFKLLFLAVLLIVISSSMARANATLTAADFSYREIKLGDNLSDVVAKVGEPLYYKDLRIQGIAVSEYVYKDDFTVSIAKKTGRVVDIVSTDKKYLFRPGIQYGATYYKLVNTYGKTPRRFIDGKIYLVYANPYENKQYLMLELDSELKYLKAVRITSLPLTEEDKEQMETDDNIDTRDLPLNQPVKLGGLF